MILGNPYRTTEISQEHSGPKVLGRQVTGTLDDTSGPKTTFFKIK